MSPAQATDRSTAVYAGSFDPLTYGHLDVIRRGSRLFDRVVVAVGTNPAKRYLLDAEHRARVVRQEVAALGNVSVDHFEGLLVDYCHRRGAGVILRGLRASTDFDFEFQIGLANRDMAPDVETVFLLTDPAHIFISSSLVKEIASNGGDVARYVPGAALQALTDALAAKR
ncbi:MAG: pantetheine-phosphate adenylyltransferase [Alphaproteobacteria bacterium]|nr:pantetheine-phosphate adenylyltransferase [Alphaproteobacteria bacterium]